MTVEKHKVIEAAQMRHPDNILLSKPKFDQTGTGSPCQLLDNLTRCHSDELILKTTSSLRLDCITV